MKEEKLIRIDTCVKIYVLCKERIVGVNVYCDAFKYSKIWNKLKNKKLRGKK